MGGTSCHANKQTGRHVTVHDVGVEECDSSQSANMHEGCHEQ